MTYAPPALIELGRYWVRHGGVNLGVVGDAAHQRKGTSYHLGRSVLADDAYSRKTARDRAGLTDAASAIDLGKLNGNLGQLRTFSKWFVARCRTNAPGTQDVREFIYSPDGRTVLRWDRERGVNSAPRTGEANNSHLAHSHISFYRDSEKRSKVGLFRPYFEPAKPVTPPATPAKEEPVSTGNRLTDAIVTRAGYLANELKAGDEAGVSAQGVKIIEFAARAIGSVAPAVAEGPISATAARAIAENPAWGILNALGFSPDNYVTYLPEGGVTVAAIDPVAIMAAADEEQERELALLGVFGQPGTNPDIDYSLFEQYYQSTGDGNWAPKDEYASTGTWQAYKAGQ